MIIFVLYNNLFNFPGPVNLSSEPERSLGLTSRNWIIKLTIKARRGGKRNFLSFHICDRTAEDEQVEKKRIKIRPCIPKILRPKSEVYL